MKKNKMMKISPEVFVMLVVLFTLTAGLLMALWHSMC